MKDVPKSNYPKLGVIGIAGPVNQNMVKEIANIQHWSPTDGTALGEIFKIEKFTLLNDFTAAGYGVSTLHHKDYTIIGGHETKMKEGAHSVKLVIGPGTGLG